MENKKNVRVRTVYPAIMRFGSSCPIQSWPPGSNVRIWLNEQSKAPDRWDVRRIDNTHNRTAGPIQRDGPLQARPYGCAKDIFFGSRTFFLRSLASVSIGKITRIFRIFKYKPCNVTSKFVPFSEIPARFNVF